MSQSVAQDRRQSVRSSRQADATGSVWALSLIQRCVALVLVTFLAGCTGSDLPASLEGSSVTVSQGSPCETGATRPCGVTLDHSADIMTCFRGVQTCEDGLWSECGGGRVTIEAKPTQIELSTGRLRSAALSQPKSCNQGGAGNDFYNPCDPGCMCYLDQEELVAPLQVEMSTLPDWSAPAGTASCSHELCEEGGKLDPACHPCVARVCDVDASCCNGNGSQAWNTECIELVHSECRGSVAPPEPTTLCDFSAFGAQWVRLGNGTVGSPSIGSMGWVRPENNANLGSVYAKGLVDLRNGASVTGNVVTESDVWVESPSTVNGNIEAGGRVDLRNVVTVTGNITAVGTVELQQKALLDGHVWTGGSLILNNNAEVTGDARSVGNITGQSGAAIGGDATVEPPSSIHSNVTVGGTASEAGPVGTPKAPVVSLPDVTQLERDLDNSCAVAAAMGRVTVNRDLTLEPGVYGEHVVSGGTKLILQPGSYVFDAMTFYASNAELSLAGVGPWDVSVCGVFRADSNMHVYLDGTQTPPEATNFVLYSHKDSGDCITIGNKSELNGILVAPRCTIRVYNSVKMTAALWADQVYTNNSLILTPIPSEICKEGDPWGDGVCDGSTVLFSPGATYSRGERVHYKETIYECDVPSRCSAASGFGGAAGYWPGEGRDWTSAWSLVGPCPDDPDVPEGPSQCPVSLDLPAAPGPRQACYSGLECQVNSRCTEVLTGDSCAHSKCALGSALSASCDPCVGWICDVEPSCCSDSGGTDWDARCVGLVETVCDASCGSPDRLACAHDACVEGVGLDADCDPDVEAVCDEPGFAYCCDTANPESWDQGCIDELYTQHTGSAPTSPAAGETVCEYAVLGSGSNPMYGMDITGNLGWYSGQLTMGKSRSDHAFVRGDVFSWDSAALDCTHISGDLRAAGTATIDGRTSSFKCGSLGGTLEEASSNLPAAPPKVTRALSCSTGGPNNYSASGVISPGVYGDLQLAGDIELQAGDYYINRLVSYSNHTITLPTDPDDQVNIYVCNDIQLNSGTQVSSPTREPLQALFYSHSGNISLQRGTFYGAYQANSGNIVFDPSGATTLYGMAHAYDGRIESSRGAVIDASGFSLADCLARGVDPSATHVACPISTNLTNSYVETGSCVDNEDDHRVSPAACDDADIAVRLSCDDNLTVCNHGNEPVPAGEVELTFYPRAGQQFGTQTPDSLWSVGSCTVSSLIPAGECVTQTCDESLVNQDLTVFASLTEDATVEECSTLDNWSYYVDSNKCGSGGDLVEVQTYEAECPKGTGAYWGYFFWNTTLTGDSRVTFEARSSKNDSFSGDYTILTTASLIPSDNSVCSFQRRDDPAFPGCLIDIGAELWPEGRVNQESFIELRITLESSGVDVPTVHDWGMTYSCVYDE